MSSAISPVARASIYPVLKFTIEGELVFWLPIRHFIHPEPIKRGLQVSGLESADVVDICEWQSSLRFNIILMTDAEGKGVKPLKSSASGSSTFMTMTFQSVSPSSISARVPNTFTRMISPREQTWPQTHMKDTLHIYCYTIFKIISIRIWFANDSFRSKCEAERLDFLINQSCLCLNCNFYTIKDQIPADKTLY